MFNRRIVGALAAGCLGAVAVFGLASTSALGVCTQIAYDGQAAVGMACYCQGPCMCIPNHQWGYYTRQWQLWPGGQVRQDIVFPQSIGVESVAVPQGTVQKPLPREKYADPETEVKPKANADNGPSTRPAETPNPYQWDPNSRYSLPGMDAEPQGPSPK